MMTGFLVGCVIRLCLSLFVCCTGQEVIFCNTDSFRLVASVGMGYDIHGITFLSSTPLDRQSKYSKVFLCEDDNVKIIVQLSIGGVLALHAEKDSSMPDWIMPRTSNLAHTASCLALALKEPSIDIECSDLPICSSHCCACIARVFHCQRQELTPPYASFSV